MNAPIEIRYPRSLILENVVSVEINAADEESIRNAATSLARFLRSNGARARGPLVQKSGPRLADGRGAMRGELLRQSSEPLQAAGVFKFRTHVEISSCIMASFHGRAADMSIVYSKLAVYSYENDVNLSGTFYVVHVADEGPVISVDVFAVTE